MPARRSSLPAPTKAQIETHADRLRRTPNGGWAWKCAHCGQYASSETAKGLYVCYRHGGNRGVQRDPVKRQKVREQTGKEPPKPSGRPATTGWYSRSEAMKVQDVVEAYRQAGENPDDTDADMLHLRARIENMLALEPLVLDITAELAETLDELREWRSEKVSDADGRTVGSVVVELDRHDDLRRTVKSLRDTLTKYLGFQEQIEFRHREVIKAAKARAETRLKDRAARELSVFGVFLQRLTLVLSEQMPPEAYGALAKRIEKDLDTVPARLIELPAATRKR